MKRKKVMYLLVVIIILTGKQPLAVQVAQTEKLGCCDEVYNYITVEKYENNNMNRMQEIIRCSSMETVCSEDFGLDIHVLLMDSSKKVHMVIIRAEKRYIGEVYLVYKKHTVIKIVTLHYFKNEFNGLKFSEMYIRIDKGGIFGVVVLEKHIMGHFFQIISLNKLKVWMFLFVAIMIILCFNDEYFRVNRFVYNVYEDMHFEDNIKRCVREFFSNLVDIIGMKGKLLIVWYVSCKEEHKHIRKLLRLADRLYLKSDKEWIHKNWSIIVYSVDRTKKIHAIILKLLQIR